jgi:VanZ family protein
LTVRESTWRRRPGWRRATAYLPTLICAAVLLWIGSRPALLLPATDLPLDKPGHFVMYGVLGAAGAWSWRRAGHWPPAAVVILLAVLVGVTDELIQSTVPGRSAELGDLVADVAGVTAGFFLGAHYLRRRARDGER